MALATGMAWLADGSDLGGSLRTPASFCGVVGLRPSPGRVPHGPRSLPFGTLAVEGPMARDVRDVALFLDVLAGFDPRDPLSLRRACGWPTPPRSSSRPGLRRVAFSADLGGITPVDPEVAAICRRAAARLAELGRRWRRRPRSRLRGRRSRPCAPRNSPADMAPLLDAHRDRLKPEVVWNIEHGLSLTAAQIGEAERQRGLLQLRMAEFLASYDLLFARPRSCRPSRWSSAILAELNGHRFPSYIDWVAMAYAITLTGCPALSLPCGFTAAGLPVGLQMVGQPRGEAELLAAAAMLEDALGWQARCRSTRRP